MKNDLPTSLRQVEPWVQAPTLDILAINEVDSMIKMVQIDRMESTKEGKLMESLKLLVWTQAILSN